MEQSVTLILILHNRHNNLDRLLDYYKEFRSPIIIADSSEMKYQLKVSRDDIRHIYTPEKTFADKIEFVLQQVVTPYVLLCADDDFIVPEGIYKCVGFLETNSDYSIAQGTCIRFYQSSLVLPHIQYDLLYDVKKYDVEANDSFSRLEQMFQNYRSVLYAVHRTSILRLAYRGAGAVVKNLFLHEYLTAVVPITSGKYKELPFLYQIREYAEGSDDKVTDNLDIIFSEKKYETELNSFIDLLVNNVSVVIREDRTVIRQEISKVLEDFSKSPLIANKPQTISFKKLVGSIMCRIPIVGTWLIRKNRQIERERKLKRALTEPGDFEQMGKIELVLKQYA